MNHYKKIRRFVDLNTVQHWVTSFLKAIPSPISMDLYSPALLLSLDRVISEYAEGTKRIIFLDYDGTLTPIRRVPAAATPSAEVTRTLRMLTSDPANHVYVISGRDQATLEGWLGGIPRLGLSAEHGCFLRPVLETGENPTWLTMVDVDSLEWRQDVTTIMEYYTERTPGSLIEFKTASVTWHYRQSDPEFGSWQAKEMQTHLENSIATKYGADVIVGKKTVEVRPGTCNKGEVVKAIMQRHGKADFVFCAGDDRTDEDMFRVLAEEYKSPNGSTSTSSGLWMLPDSAESVFTCRVGGSTKKTLARYRLPAPESIISLLMRLCSLMAARNSAVTL